MEQKRQEQAADWYARLNGGAASEADWLAFTDWLEADDANRLAYDAVEDALELTLGHQAEVEAAFAEAAVQPSGVVIDARWRWAKPAIAAAMAAAALLFVAVGLNLFGAKAPTTETYMTAAGERRDVALADGTVLHLNTNSRLDIQLGDDERHATLAYGEAMFEVAKDKDRPFLVAANDRQIRVVGTKFNVRNYDDTVTVAVAEGIVDVAPAQSTASSETKVRLTIGKRLVHQVGADTSIVSDVDVADVAGWQDGFLTYEDTPMAQVAADLNRYFTTPIALEAGVDTLHFSGILKTDDQDAVLALFAEILPIEVIRADDKITLRLKE